MPEPQVIVSTDAEADLDEVAALIASDSPEQAIRWLDRIATQFQRIARTPGMGTARAQYAADLRSVRLGSTGSTSVRPEAALRSCA